MLHRRRLLDTDGVRVTDVRCDGAGEVWSQPERANSFSIVLVRAGLFRRRCEGAEVVVDATSGYVQRAGMVERMAHPCGGDVCTSITLDSRLLRSVLDGRAVPAGLVFTTPRLDLAHRTLVARAGQGADPFEITERALGVVAGALAPHAPRPQTARRAGTEARRRRLVDHSRQVLDHDCGIGLVDLARVLAVSPHHLSRVFAEATGLTLSAYRARLRTRRALERLAAGDRDLAGLAADLGFSDQAHLTRTVRAQTGIPPGRLRRLLAPPAAAVRDPAHRLDELPNVGHPVLGQGAHPPVPPAGNSATQSCSTCRDGTRTGGPGIRARASADVASAPTITRR